MTSDELNAKLQELSDREDFAPSALAGTGKLLPYYGWFWRSVDFDHPITFAYANGCGDDVPGWVGFCENNKWDYEMFTASADDSKRVRELAEALASEPSHETAQALFDYMQSIRPADVTGTRRWGDNP